MPPDKNHRKAICPACGRKYEQKREWQKYCSTACRRKAWTFSKASMAVLADHEARIRALEEKLKIKEGNL